MKKTKKQEKLDEVRITRIFGQVANGVQIPIMKLGAIYSAGMAALDGGGNDAAIALAIDDKVKQYRVSQ